MTHQSPDSPPPDPDRSEPARSDLDPGTERSGTSPETPTPSSGTHAPGRRAVLVGAERTGRSLLRQLRQVSHRLRQWAGPLLVTALAWLRRTSQRAQQWAEPALAPTLARLRKTARRLRRWADPVLAPALARLRKVWIPSSDRLHRVHPRMRVLQLGTAAAAVAVLAGLVGNAGSPSEQGVTLAAKQEPLSGQSRSLFGSDSEAESIHDWAEKATTDTGVPVPALESYAHAERALQQKQPGCGLPWNVLAGIGRVESRHGHFGGAVLQSDGNTSQPIIGIALNGSGVDTVTDTDGGQLDGDTVHDRAVGPMQFIPQTWNSWATDGNGDGRTDPQSLDDSAATAGNYLCGSKPSGDLSTRSDQTDALMTYNQSSSYGQMVLEFAEQYERNAPPLPTDE